LKLGAGFGKEGNSGQKFLSVIRTLYIGGGAITQKRGDQARRGNPRGAVYKIAKSKKPEK